MLIKKAKDNYTQKWIIILIPVLTLIVGVQFSQEIKETYSIITGFYLINTNSTINQTLTKNLTVYYSFDNDNLNEDITPINHTISGTNITTGVYNKGLKFNGESDYLSINTTTNTVNKSNTVSYWIKANNQKNNYNQGIIFAVNVYSHEHLISDNCLLTIYRWNGATNYNYYLKNCRDSWYHIVETYDDYTKVSRLYINGEYIKRHVGTKTTGDTGIIYIGKSNDGTDRYFNGTIDELRVYDKILNEEEIKALYHGANYKQEEISYEKTIIKLNINNEDYKKLEKKREDALEKGFLIKSDEDLVPAVVEYKNESITVEVRLKGDLLDHLDTEKWSFRITIKDNKTIDGMKEISLQAPERRGVNEWLYYKLLEMEGLIALRYIPVEFYLNNKLLGEYTIEESFSKELLENNNKTEGPIIKIDEDLSWSIISERQGINFLDFKLIANVDAFSMNSILKDEQEYQKFITGREMLYQSLNESITDIYDLEKLAKFMAIIDLMGAHHGFIEHNMRFYYNPITSLLEPIGYDANAGEPINLLSYNIITDYNWLNLNLKNTNFIKKYIQNIVKFSNNDYINKILALDIPVNTNREVIMYNQEQINKILNPITAIQAYAEIYDDQILKIKIGNIQKLPIEILELNYNGVKISENENNTKILWSDNTRVTFIEYEFKMPQGFEYNYKNIEKLDITYKILGTDKLKSEIVHPYPQTTDISEELNIKESNFDTFDFMSYRNSIIITGEHTINKTLVVPKGFILTAYPGTKIDLVNNATIISYSPVNFIGTSEEPVTIMSSDGTGQGLTLLQAENESVIDNVIFYNLSEPRQGNWHLTGAVTFYESPVKITNSRFLSSNAEDALNIKNSEFNISNNLFKNTKSDCLDLDFTTGTISNSEFTNCGGDGLDTSGSIITINNVKINKTGDKGISIGEASIATINDAKISNTYLGLASKDSSIINAQGVIFTNNTYDLTAYQKKEEYGPSNITINAIINNYLCELNSNININSADTTNKTNRVFNLLYTSNNVRRV